MNKLKNLIAEDMRAIEISEPGNANVLVPTRRPTPKPGHGEVLIHVAAAGVNRPDIMQRQGSYPAPTGASDIPGLEVAGRVVGCGPGVRRYKIDDDVCALVTGGGYAEYCLAPEIQTLPFPAGYSAAEASSLPENFFTVWTNLFERGRLAAGERLLIHGGSSGIGTAAIQLATTFGVRVFATASSENKCNVCRQLGAELAINYQTDDYLAAIKSATDGEGVDLVLDMVGGDYIQRNLRCLRTEGRLVQIAFLKGSETVLNLMPLMLKRLTITGSTLRAQSTSAKGRIAAALETEVWPLLAARQIAPVIDSSFSLENAAEAHARMETSAHIGKILLIPGGQ
ncbi:MAG: NAD(P)H-quinone oxidoreductase [Rhodospirillaceae bacterium]|nr:NAD(P)H-quinone oxidoreductase [Rhodospirillaceae bacterium]|tara:strand:+ start:290 stop:1309 length:1020 start_codon:yes stop_codon:yes gene_type:complete